ncbi:hypothetical protein DFH07DRAFT_953680 [Mycena maculata]|uniref:Uncharacterized protein n=1 Tax=Mycena maculata TaxID=230809 RepID=A0AAD7NQ69_9AGAR|nr:hypothetical protein DFH07DRAFT_953680 [Mycena maculata]
MTTSPRRTHRKRVSGLHLSSETIDWRDVIPPPEYEADEDTDDNSSPSQIAYIPPLSPRPQAHTRRTHRRKPSTPNPQDAFLDSLLERSVHALELSNALLQSSISTPSPSAFREPSPTAPVTVPAPREPWADNMAAIARDVDELLVSSSLPTVSPASQRRKPRRRPSLDPMAPASYSSSPSHSTNTSYSSTSGLQIAPSHRSRLVAPAPRALTQYVGAGNGSPDDDAIALPSTLGLRAPPSDWRGVSGLPHDSHSDSYSNSSRGGSVDWRGVGLPPPHEAQWRTIPSDWRGVGPPAPASPALSARSPEPSTPAYTLLSTFVRGEQSPPPRETSPKTSPRIVTGAQRSPSRSSRGSRSSSRGSSANGRGGAQTPRRARSLTPPLEVSDGSPNLSQGHGGDDAGSERGGRVHERGATATPRPAFTSHPNGSTISHTLPSPAHSRSSSSSSGNGDEGCQGKGKEREGCGKGKGRCRAKAARSALRKILDEAPKPPPPPPRPRKEFHPRSPPPAAHAAASTATASVSRLFSRGGRHSVTRGDEEGRGVVGIMKGTRAPTPGASTSAAGAAEGGNGNGGMSVTAPPTPTWGSALGFFPRGGSGASTPATPASGKRISFAELPESYAGSRPGSRLGSARRSKSKSKSRKGKGKGKGKACEGSEEGEEEGSGWFAWLVGGSSSSSGYASANGYSSASGYASDVGERERDRLGVGGGTRGSVWGGMGMMGGLGIGGGTGRGAGDEWAV